MLLAEPAGQLVHPDSVEPGMIPKDPTGQLWHVVFEVAAAAFEYDPDGHKVQTAWPVTCAYEPGLQG